MLLFSVKQASQDLTSCFEDSMSPKSPLNTLKTNYNSNKKCSTRFHFCLSKTIKQSRQVSQLTKIIMIFTGSF